MNVDNSFNNKEPSYLFSDPFRSELPGATKFFHFAFHFFTGGIPLGIYHIYHCCFPRKTEEDNDETGIELQDVAIKSVVSKRQVQLSAPGESSTALGSSSDSPPSSLASKASPFVSRADREPPLEGYQLSAEISKGELEKVESLLRAATGYRKGQSFIIYPAYYKVEGDTIVVDTPKLLPIATVREGDKTFFVSTKEALKKLVGPLLMKTLKGDSDDSWGVSLSHYPFMSFVMKELATCEFYAACNDRQIEICYVDVFAIFPGVEGFKTKDNVITAEF